MKYLLYRLTALVLAGLLLFSAGGLCVFASQPGFPDPACRLGTTSQAMLAGGGSFVDTDRGTYYVDESDGSVRLLSDRSRVIVAGPAAKLNYEDGVLYFAREREEGVFDLCSFDLASRTEKVLLGGFCGRLGQVYLVDGTYLDFSCDNAVWQLDLETGFYRLICFARDLWSFVPTGGGVIYATGTLFDYSLYADGLLLAEHVDDYSVDFGIGEDGALVYTCEGQDCQMDLPAACAGVAVPTRFKGYAYTNLSADTEPAELTEAERAALLEAENERLSRELSEFLNTPENRPQTLGPAVDTDVEPAPADPAEADSNDPLAPEQPTEPETEPTEPAPELEPTEPAETEKEPAEEPTEPAETEKEPAEEPTEPAETEKEPAEEPTEPAETEKEPAEEPTEPAETEKEPAEAPTEPAEPAPVPGEADADTPEPAEPTEPIEIEPLDPEEDEPPIIVQIPDPAPVQNLDGANRRSASTGVQNIVRRARQMLNIRWTPRKDVKSWTNSDNGAYVVYKKGVTYTGLPYSQSCSYVPWYTSLDNFIKCVNDTSSKMYSARGGGSGTGPYYGIDCSGFTSWSWDTGKINHNIMGSGSDVRTVIGNSYTQLQVGDAILSNWHARLCTDVTYDSSGAITSIEISEANPTISMNDCCASYRYSGTTALKSWENNVLKKGYTIYRNVKRDQVTYTHSCSVPLEGDECVSCGTGMFLKPGIDVSCWQGTVNWQAVAAEVSFAILRVGYTGVENPIQAIDTRFEDNAQGCEANHIPYGVYFYGGATTAEMAMQEAQKVLDYIGVDRIRNESIALPVFYDVEAAGMLNLSNEKLLEVITAFCSTLEDFGLRAGVYASTSVWNSKLTSPAYNSWVRWAAQWESSTCTVQNGVNLWQYSDKGRLPGIATDVDLNYWLGTVGDMEHRYRTSETSATCTEDGRITYTCVHCGKTYDKTLPALGHNYAKGVCTRCGGFQPIHERYSDIHQGKWYYDAVAYTVCHGLFAGEYDDVFGRDNAMDRAMLVTVLYRLAGEPPVAKENLYEDVRPNSYYEDAVIWASHYGITYGTTEKLFSPKQDVTREQTAAFLFRYLMNLDPNNNDRTDLAIFPDADEVSNFARESLSWAVAARVIQGSKQEDGTVVLAPKASATRAEVAVMLYHFCLYLEQKGLLGAADSAFQPPMR